MSYYFVMVGHEDNPIFEVEYSRAHHTGTQERQSSAQKKDDLLHLHQFTAHASLDIIDENKWVSNNLNFKALDRFNEYIVSAFVTPSQIRFVMLHLDRNDDGIKSFFHEVFELYTKLSLNPFYSPGTKIHFQSFQQRVNTLCKKFL